MPRQPDLRARSRAEAAERRVMRRHAAFVDSYFHRSRDRGERPHAPALSSTHHATLPRRAARSAEAPSTAVELLVADDRFLELIPHTLLRQQWILPMRGADGGLLVATGRPLTPAVTAALQDATGKRPREVYAPEQRVRTALAERLRAEDVAAISATLPDELSARRVIAPQHLLIVGGLLVALAVGLVLSPLRTIIGVIAASLALYAVSTAYKLAMLGMSLWSRRHVPVRRLPDDALPSYTLLVPLYREGGVLPRLVAGLSAMDYPKDRLEVFLLLEEDDLETRAVAEATALPPWMTALVVPDGRPKGKPRALNYGLAYASSELCVIFDAEDIPEPTQLRSAAEAFAQEGADVACVQCALAFYNGRQNALTNLFTIEYATWFEFVLPSLFHSGAPLPLGGTSNHFRVDVLRELGGWDAFNVTEDADLGMRLARAGHRTVTVDSVTLEEANSRLWNWVRQRTRWNKGHMVTYLVHMRHPIRLWREVGTVGFWSWQMLAGGVLLTQLMNPIFWALLAVWYGTGWSVMRELFPLPLLYAGNVLLFGSTFAYVTFGALACLRNRHYYAAPFALLLPVYWLMQSFGTYRALFQLIFSPHTWEKTEHNLVSEAALRRSGLLGAPEPARVVVVDETDRPRGAR